MVKQLEESKIILNNLTVTNVNILLVKLVPLCSCHLLHRIHDHQQGLSESYIANCIPNTNAFPSLFTYQDAAMVMNIGKTVESWSGRACKIVQIPFVACSFSALSLLY